MDENVYVENMRDGAAFVGFYALHRCDLRETESLCRLEVDLADKTGHVPGVVWDGARELSSELHKGSVVKVRSEEHTSELQSHC